MHNSLIYAIWHSLAFSNEESAFHYSLFAILSSTSWEWLLTDNESMISKFLNQIIIFSPKCNVILHTNHPFVFFPFSLTSVRLNFALSSLEFLMQYKLKFGNPGKSFFLIIPPFNISDTPRWLTFFKYIIVYHNSMIVKCWIVKLSAL